MSISILSYLTWFRSSASLCNEHIPNNLFDFKPIFILHLATGLQFNRPICCLLSTHLFCPPKHSFSATHLQFSRLMGCLWSTHSFVLCPPTCLSFFHQKVYYIVHDWPFLLSTLSFVFSTTTGADPSWIMMGTHVCSLILSRQSAIMGSRVACKNLLANTSHIAGNNTSQTQWCSKTSLILRSLA